MADGAECGSRESLILNRACGAPPKVDAEQKKECGNAGYDVVG